MDDIDLHLIPRHEFHHELAQPVEHRFSDVARCHGGLWPHEILLLDHVEGRATDNHDIGDFWQDDYGVSDPDGTLRSLLQRGFMRSTTLTEAIDEATTIPILKAELIQRDLPTKGKKADLVDCLIANESADALEAAYPNRRYVNQNRYGTELIGCQRNGWNCQDLSVLQLQLACG